MFEQMAEYILAASTIQLEIFEHEDPVKEKDLIKKIREIESAADDTAQKLFDDLDKTFVTPFDREDMHQLIATLDTIIDLIKSVSQRLRMYRPKNMPAECKDLAKVILRGAEQIQSAVSELKTMKKTTKIFKAVRKMTDIESEADELYHNTISNIFKNEKDAIELIKQKEIVENMERTADRIEDVSDVLKTIILKTA